MKVWKLVFALLGTLVHGYQPNQVHIAPGDDNRTMVITWSTVKDTSKSIVQYGTSASALSQEAIGTSKLLLNDLCVIETLVLRSFCYTTVKQHVHKVAINNLEPDTTYYYRCGNENGWSGVFNFTTVPEGSSWPLELIVFGDLGTDSETTEYLIKEARTGQWRLFFHLGDMAYNLDSEGGAIGDTFLRQIEPIAAYYPYLAAVGNHENYANFSNFKIRFQMPGDADNMFYSYKIGPLLLIAVSTEVFYGKGKVSKARQRAWLEKTLKEANEPANRSARPWIVVCGHRPMYHSKTINILGWLPNYKMREGFEDLFYKYGVDLAFWGHEHVYERLYPIYNGKVMKGDVSPYVNPKGPVHFISGAAGNRVGQRFFLDNPDFVAYRSSDVGYTRLLVHNSSDLYIEQVSVKAKGDVIDKVLIHKDKHGPYS